MSIKKKKLRFSYIHTCCIHVDAPYAAEQRTLDVQHNAISLLSYLTFYSCIKSVKRFNEKYVTSNREKSKANRGIIAPRGCIRRTFELVVYMTLTRKIVLGKTRQNYRLKLTLHIDCLMFYSSSYNEVEIIRSWTSFSKRSIMWTEYITNVSPLWNATCVLELLNCYTNFQCLLTNTK